MNWFKKKKPEEICTFAQAEVIYDKLIEDIEGLDRPLFSTRMRNNSIYPYGLDKQWELGEGK